jgi:hypothetical protein
MLTELHNDFFSSFILSFLHLLKCIHCLPPPPQIPCHFRAEPIPSLFFSNFVEEKT